MPLTFSIAATTIGLPIAKFLLKSFLGDGTAAVGSGLVDLAARRMQSEEEQRVAARQFEDIGDRVVKRLIPLFSNVPDNSAAAIAHEVGSTLSENVSAEFFLERDLDPKKLSAAFRALRDLPAGHFSVAEKSLYERCLDEAVRYVVGIAADLPRFEATSVGATLARLTRLQSDLDKALEKISAIERLVDRGGVADAEEEQNRRYEADYRQALARRLDYLELFGVDVSQEAQRHSLTAGYVSLNVTRGDDDHVSETFKASDLYVLLLSGKKRLLIRGDAGSGKSTLLRWFAIRAATGSGAHAKGVDTLLRWFREFVRPKTLHYPLFDSDEHRGFVVAEATLSALRFPDSGEAKAVFAPSQLSNYAKWAYGKKLADVGRVSNIQFAPLTRRAIEPVPFLVRLRDCQGGRLPLPECLPTLISSELGNPPEDWVRTILKSGRGLLLFDGVDEVPNAKREDTRRDIKAIIEQYPKNSFVVSTRPAAVPEGWLDQVGFVEMSINPMGETDRSEFIRRWHQAVSGELALQGKSSDLSALAEELTAAVSENPPIARLATNPLLCALICALHKDRHRKLPENQSELCEAVCQLLLHRREREAGLAIGEFPEPYRNLSYLQKKAIIQEIARRMVSNDVSTIEESDATAACADVLRTFPDSRLEDDAGFVLKSLVERSGVLREQRPGHIDFVHNTVKEYLAAQLFVAENFVNGLALRCLDEGWRQIALFACAGSDRTFATRLTKCILERANNATTDLVARRLRLTAVSCRYAALHLDSQLTSEIGRIEKTLIPPRTMADAESLATMGDNVVSLLRYEQRPARQTAACVRALRLVGSSAAKRTLTGYYNDTRHSVVAELVQAVNPLFIGAVRERVTQYGYFPSHWARYIDDLSHLSTFNDAEVINLDESSASDLTPIAALTGVRELYLGGTKIKSVEALASLKRMEVLDISGTSVSDLSPLTEMHHLRWLHCSETPVDDIAPISKLTSLEALNISFSAVSNLAPIGNLTNLGELSILGLHGIDWTPVAALKRLKELFANGSDPVNLEVIASLPQLEWLGLIGTAVSDIAPLAKLKNLSNLYLSQTGVREVDVLATLPELRELLLDGCELVDHSPIAKLNNLDRLELSGTGLSDISIVSDMRELSILDISKNQIVDYGPLSGLSNLAMLTLDELSVKTTEMLVGLPKLSFVQVTGEASRHDVDLLRDVGKQVVAAVVTD